MTGHNIRIPEEAFGVVPQSKWIVHRRPGQDALVFNCRQEAIDYVVREARACAIPERIISRWKWRARHVRYTAVCPWDIRFYTNAGGITRAEPIANWRRVWKCLREGRPLPDPRICAVVGNRAVPADQCTDEPDCLVRLSR